MQGFLLENLKRINLNTSLSITILPDLCAPNLEELDISFCENLIEIHEAIGSLEKLKCWNLKGCKKLQILPSSFRLKSLEYIDLDDCVSLETLPNLGAPNLRKLNIGDCENLIEIHEAFGSLDKLDNFDVHNCKKLQILPNTLRLKSLEGLSLNGCVSLEKFPNIHPENICYAVDFSDCNVKEWPLSVGYFFSGLTELSLDNYQSLGDFHVSISRCKFTKLRVLSIKKYDGNIIESHILMKPDSFPLLTRLELDDSNIVTIPGSIISFTRLQELSMTSCKNLREIPRLPQTIRSVNATKCTSLDLPSSHRLLNQVSSHPPLFIRVSLSDTYITRISKFQFLVFAKCKQFQELFMNRPISCQFILPRIEIPKWFKLNHQSVGNSVSFRVGREFQKLILCFACRVEARFYGNCFVVSANGFSQNEPLSLYSIKGVSEHLCIHTVYIWERKWEKSNPSEQNDVTITVEIKSSSSDDTKITWLGVHVDCICCGYGSSSVSDDIDHHSFPSDVGLQIDSNASIDGCSPLVLDDIEHHSLPSDVLPVDTKNGSDLGLGWQDLGFSDGLHLGSSSVAHAFDDIDTDFNLFPPSKKARTS